MIDFEGIDKRNAEWRDWASKAFVPGVDPAELKPGQLVTVSPNLMCHDNSYTREVLTIVAVNTAHVQVRRADSANTLLVLPVHQHHFYLADNFEAE